MPVTVQTPFNESTANGATTVFPYTFKLLAEGDLDVYLDGALQGSGYTVSGVGNAGGGNVTFTVAPANGVIVLLKRAPPLSRSTDYQDGGDFLASDFDNDLDRIWMKLQQFGQDIKRALKLPFSTTTDQEVVAVANKALILDASGNLDLSTDDYNDQLANVTAQASAAASSAAAASTSASNASTSASNASSSASAASSSASSASTSATNASNSASAAATSASNAATSETNAASSASAASTSASNASTSATNASNSATAAAASATEAEGYLAPVTATSASSVAIGTGSKSFTVETGKAFVAGHPIRISDTSAPSTNYMTGTVTSYNSGTGALVVDVTATAGSGTISSWTIALVASTTDASKLPLAGGTMSGDIVMGNNDITGTKTVGFNAELDNGNSGTTKTVTLADAQKQKLTLTGNVALTISFTGAPVGNYQLRLIQDATGSRTVTWTGLSASRWLGATSAPAINSAANGETIVSIFYDGTNAVQSASKVGAV